ncbi:MAG: aminodeoxychorismate synthase component I [Pseudomonadota bacterium]
MKASDPVDVLSTSQLADVPALVAEVEQRIAGGLTAIGYVAYDAAPAFDPSLVVYETSHQNRPLISFGLFEREVRLPDPTMVTQSPGDSVHVKSKTTEEQYTSTYDRIQSYLHAGDSYQVNLTHQLAVSGKGSPQALFGTLVQRQQCRYPIFIQEPHQAILSLSPELFFELDNDLIVCRPMKGTRRRSLDPTLDEAARTELSGSDKDRAENLMIVDMIRNDLGRIATPGTVHVSDLFRIEPYPTVWQMTSTVEAKTQSSLGDILTALFPCASITGAPKVHTMSIIRELESEPRGLYTGALGILRPDRKFRFSVAIRTLLIDIDDRIKGDGDQAWRGHYGVGGGIVADSRSESEWDESLAKAAILGSDVSSGADDL